MVRRKQCARASPGDWSYQRNNCYETGVVLYQPPPPNREERAANRHSKQPASEKRLLALENCPDLSQFRTLPLELQMRIWEMVAEEERVVAVHSTTNDGLRAKVPPMLHVCALSRSVGLKIYKLSFGIEGSSEARYMVNSDGPSQPLSPPPRIYFNFDRDILYFKEGWNEKIDGPWSCINHLKRLLNLDDMETVEKLGIDLGASICCPRSSSEHLHRLYLAPWKGLKTLYLGLKDDNSADASDVAFQEIGAEHHEKFLQKYKDSPVHCVLPEDLSVDQALDFIKTSSGKIYGTHSGRAGHMVLAEDFCEKVCPVLVQA